VIAIFALGIAANTTIFSIFNGLFLSALPYPSSGRLLYLNEAAPKWNLPKDVGIAYPDFYAWRAQNRTFDSMAVWGSANWNLSGSGEAVHVEGVTVSWDLARTFGIKPVLGRDFTEQEDRKGGAKVVMLGYDLWRSKFAGSGDVLGKVLKLDDQAYTIIGVLPKNAVFPDHADVWMPLAADPADDSTGYFLSGVGRLKAGVTIEQARADLMRIHKAAIPTRGVNQLTYPTAIPLREEYLGDYRLVTQVLLGAVGFVLLIACVNVAGLMMARSTGRARELAIRSAMGADRMRLMGQLLGESVILAAAGGAVGIALGWMGLDSMLSLMPDVLPRWVSFHLDWRFAAFAIVVTGAAAVMAGLGPAFESARVDVRGFLADAGPKSSLSGARRRVMNALVVAEIALALILLASAGLLVRAFHNVVNVRAGFRPQNVLSFRIELPDTKYPKPEHRIPLYENVLAKLRAAPGVESAGGATLPPLTGHSGTFFIKEGQAGSMKADENNPVTLRIAAMPGYFAAMGIRLDAGRDFDDRDNDKKPVAIVNETLAHMFWGNENAVGKLISYRGNKPEWMPVVGVVEDTRHYGLDEDVRPAVYLPYRELPQPAMYFVMRGSGNLTGAARETMRQADPDLAMYDVYMMQERVEKSIWARRTYSWLFAVFAGVALALAMAGIYGVVSYAVTERTREIGIRMALGADAGRVLARVLREGMTLAAIGVGIGLIGAFAATRLIGSLLVGVSAHDPWSFTAVSIVLGVVALAANFVPARRASKVEPMEALRLE
jgi:predicted permease